MIIKQKRIKPTEAFKKYIDPVFLCQNHLWDYAPKSYSERFDGHNFKLETYDDEEYLRAGMCVFLAEEIQENLNFKHTLKVNKDKLREVASNWDLDYVEADKQFNELEEKTFAHAKLQYCFDNYINDIRTDLDIEILACLMAMYAKIMKLKKDKLNQHVKDVTHSKFYRYVKDSYLEDCGQNIKKYAQFSFMDFANKIFDLIVERCYDSEHLINESMLSAEGDEIVLRVYSIEELNDIADLKKEMEQEVKDWMMIESYKQDGLLSY